MTVGLGTGSTAAYLIAPLASRKLDIVCVSTSPATAAAATQFGLKVVGFTGLEAPAHLDITIDGADQVAPSGWLVKGGGGAHKREKEVHAATNRFVVIVSSNKLVDRLRPPVPLELSRFGLAGTLARLEHVRIRNGPLSPDGGVIADYLAEFDDAEALSARLCDAAGVVAHGLFPPSMVAEILVGRSDSVERIPVSRATA